MPRFASVNEDLILEVGGANDLVLERNGVEVDRRGAEGFGKVLQVVYITDGVLGTGAITTPLDNTIPQITEGNEALSCSISPLSASSFLEIDVHITAGEVANTGNGITVALFRDSTANAIASRGAGSYFTPTLSIQGGMFSFKTTVPSVSTSSTTFTVRVGSDAGSVNWNGWKGINYGGTSNIASLTITEIAQ